MKKVFLALIVLLSLIIAPSQVLAVSAGNACTGGPGNGNCDAGLFCGVLNECEPKIITGGSLNCFENFECQSNNCNPESNECEAATTPTPTDVCTADTDCPSNKYCLIAGDGTTSCVNKLANGATGCFRNSNCVSNNCDLATATCQAATGAPTPPVGSTTPLGAETTPAIEAETETETTRLVNPLGTDSLQVIIGRVIRFFIGIAGTTALAVLVYGGIILLISGGRDTYIKKGRNAVIYSVLGLAIIFSSYILVKFIIAALSQA
ncbi:hypothetical protein A2533_03005 [Candidatus Falkowbacteria bacterium RIFOXYD2_FULL_35_9]|uniref:Dickkopf N-terminal cysteine-rich domain-containing protein n=1 Tax=Candidatus Falkowbacteria bacterium RIFOXYC2_FULL_36_12 TaxID=1798002 RepID=A0A1F5T098_9BACT|nr:MAG: hypothetical protein A2300_00250 [Candidatus Falkowbacteria bacterium RIFOXYB2_FULL_35_7]OGF31891.1 MAG: hypothetical protein A2478_05415 [Candidatus Falkowbacteria bacterium RIFOXYC2_FULL_36_12]OGF33996.1 MAG: hypothetical protein A2223_01805 [Candidatus Falkowbacteria bacterium RIFOXYA2_FULL_35_8]OGF47722.1 MAG: hypothetical protein A2533_03005 [Candidatus Falkowbacteria bacterium RIFOXYD2_FULL_35_9]